MTAKPQSSKKSKASSTSASTPTTAKSPATTSGAKRERAEGDPDLPKKAKSAFNHFVRQNRKEVEAELGGTDVDTTLLKEVLLSRWQDIERAGKAGRYVSEAEEDRKRYEREMAEYVKMTSGKKK